MTGNLPLLAAAPDWCGDGQHFMPLDNCVETMRQTSIDMCDHCKETSTSRLAVNVVQC